MNFDCTPWFETSMPPVRSGVYELRDLGQVPTWCGFAYFDTVSDRWLQPRDTIEGAVAQDALIQPLEGAQPYDMVWRGMSAEVA